jgi:hypothetical protein
VPEINLQIGLDPELQARLDRAHRGYLEHREKAKRAAARKALIKRRHPPVNIVGGYRFPGAPAIDFSPIDPPPEWATASRWVPTGDGSTIEDIPDFLNRISAASRPAATNGTGLVPETGPVSQRVAA